MSDHDQFEMAATGDAMITRELEPHPSVASRFDSLVELLQDPTMTVTNLEVLLHNYEAEKGVYPHRSGGTYMRAPPTVLKELSAIGCDAFTAAQNHVLDYGYGGLLSTIEELESQSSTFAGMGRNEFEARRPAYHETPAGRVAVLSVTTRFTTGMEASPQTDAMHGSPGINPLHLEKISRVPEEHIKSLRQTSEILNFEDIKQEWIDRGHQVRHDWLNDEYFHFWDMKFETVDSEDEAGIYHQVSDDDVEAITEWIEEADRNADWVVMGFHTHASELGYFNKQTTPAFAQRFARCCVDAGADTVVGTGPHKLRGMELYDESPIFYSLGNFIDQREHIARFPPDIYDRYDIDDYTKPTKVFDARWSDDEGNPSGDLSNPHWWQSIVPICQFDLDDGLTSIEIHPVSLQQHAGRPHRGSPVLASGDTANDILSNFADLSEPFGTTIDRDGDKAVVKV